MVMDVSVLDSEFTADGGAGSSRNASFHPIPWNFSLSDLNCISFFFLHLKERFSHVVLYNMSWLLDKDVSVADIGALGKLSRPSDSDIGFRRWTSLF